MNRTATMRAFRSPVGLTLVELLVALVMVLILLGGLATVFVANKQTYRHQEALARLQENGRIALALLERDIRGAGGGSVLVDTALAADTVVAVDKKDCGMPALGGVGTAIEGYQIGQDSLPGDLVNFFSGHKIAPLTGTDLIRVSSASELGIDISFDPAGKNNLDDPNASLQISACQGLYAGQVVIAVTLDGTRASRFMVSSCNPGNKKSELLHRPNQELTGVGVKNCDHRLRADFSGGYLVAFDSSVYFIAMTNRNVPALYRSVNLGVPEELVEGVEDMQVQFGVGPDSTRVAENYQPAVNIWTPIDTDATWDNVRSVRLQLLLQSADSNVLQAANSVEFDSPDFVAWNRDEYTDGRWRQVYSTTIALRNRLP